VEVLGEVDGAARREGGGQATTELWYARIVRFEGDRTVANEDGLNVDDYGRDTIALTVQWFHQAKEVQAHLATQPKSDVVDHVVAALADDEYLAGTSEDSIAWGTVNSRSLNSALLWVADALW